MCDPVRASLEDIAAGLGVSLEVLRELTVREVRARLMGDGLARWIADAVRKGAVRG